MKTYPSILGPAKAPHEHCIAFYKYDGSNIRVEWNKKRGFNKFGTRKNMIDDQNEWFGEVVPNFKENWEDKLNSAIKTKQFRSMSKCTFFFEWFGKESFAGQHEENDEKILVLIDVNPHKKGILGPRDFLNHFGHLENVAEVVYEGILNKPFMQSIMNNAIDLKSNLSIKQPIPEGVICKSGKGHKLWMRKIKTKIWKDELKIRKPDDWEDFI